MSHELSDIHAALHDGLAACDALDTWVEGADARDRVRARRASLKRGLEAYERLGRDLRDGRKQISPAAEEAFDKAQPRAVNLTEATKGHCLCDTCEGTGTGMEMVCYGGEPVEKTVACPDCDGAGEIEIETGAVKAAIGDVK
jgi:hypothetical protein